MIIYAGKDYQDVSRKAANIMSAQIIMKPDAVLGLATGSTPVGMYAQLVEWYKKGDLDFSRVTSVNLDEYKGLSGDNDQSYRYFMDHNLFDHVNIDKERTFVPDGLEEDSDKACAQYNEIIRIAALDENDETFCADVHTTEYYQELRSETDESIWMAEYMQEPFEAKGLLFPKSSLMRFKLADIAGKKPDGTLGSCDTADKGDDDFCAPFAKVFGPRYFITDVLFTKDPVEVTEPRLAQMVIDTECDQLRIESNNGGRIFAINVRKLVTAKKKSCVIQARPTTQHKETRIIMKAGWIKKHCVFLDESEYPKGSDYWRFMKSLTSYKREGDNAYDDAPDGMTILAEFAESIGLKLKTSTRKVGRG